MPMLYNAGEVLEIAQQIERNGARFYRQAAAGASAERAREALQALAVMEDRHEKAFAQMAAALSPQERQEVLYDPYDESVQYLRAVAGGRVFDLRSDPVAWLEGGRTMSEILHKAIQMEKDSIIYYLGLKAVVPDALGKGKVDDVIQEEMRHVTLLETMMGFPEAAG